ncbi:sensor histidine kinase [Hymenobacter humi]|uniref:histidine kinase n=1 Tax=Hymenobacter humi TaxID=1411620 RepID=A0ABW2U7Q6_9BACT
MLEQACLHLLDNGCKFSPAGQVQVLLKRNGPHARLEFRDHGSGIQLKERPHIFEPFYRGSNARSSPGHGLGLALVQRVVELHAGTVQVVTGPEPGTAMAVELPLVH